MIPGRARNWSAVNTIQQSTLNKRQKMTTLPLINSISRSFPVRFHSCPARVRLLGATRHGAGSHSAAGWRLSWRNTAKGQSALLSLTSGGYNTAIGFWSLRSDTTTSFNTGIGAGTLFANIGEQNTATGALALLSNTTGSLNTANGTSALFGNIAGFANTGHWR